MPPRRGVPAAADGRRFPEIDMPLDPQAKYVLDLAREAGNPEYWQMSVAEARRLHNERAAKLSFAPTPLFAVHDRSVPGPAGEIPLRVYVPRRSDTALPALVWYHGGGHTIGTLESYDAVCRRLSLEAGCIVVAVDYRLAPEHRFPAAVDDCFAALRWVAHNANDLGADPAKLAVGGDSAGGNLAAVCSILARDAGSPDLAFQLLIYPVTGDALDTASHRDCAEGYLLTRRSIEWFWDNYCPDRSQRHDFRFAPLNAKDFEGLPAALVIVAGYDPLRDEGIAYAERLEAAGNRVELTNYPGMIHAFLSLGGVMGAAAQAIAQSAKALRRAFGEAI